MTTLVGAEIRKLTTTRSTWWLLGALAAVSAALTGAMLFAGYALDYAGAAPGVREGALLVYRQPAATVYVIPLVVGTLLVTREYHTRTIVPTLLGEPRRGVVYAAKVLGGAAASAVCAAAAVAVTAAVAASVFAANGDETFLADGAVVATLAGTFGSLALWGLMGVGLGALLRNQAAALTLALVATLLLEPVLGIVLNTADMPEAAAYLPGGAANRMAGGTAFGEEGSALTGFAVLAGYTAAALAAGAARFLRYEP
ncbi:ABC transporter permease subunit [Nocardiopsis sp. RSe5-2]|uniref:ABC transporter permease subunit n=1 Tax=Nocardiopsis endophytica TaxID=3018445 RepID=A0ABT4UDI9_9ACTN|nr:ABC transporter permease subunit [Nocardiopsis endophytica]MDA2815036.1 ABC transporter permease subunit [Nocardiopsis endophytica]